jgi:hypothetical protein
MPRLSGVRFVRGSNKKPVAMYYMSKKLVDEYYPHFYGRRSPAGYAATEIGELRNNLIELSDIVSTRSDYEENKDIAYEISDLIQRIRADIKKYNLPDSTPYTVTVRLKSSFVDDVGIHETYHAYVRNLEDAENEREHGTNYIRLSGIADKRLFVAVSQMMGTSKYAEQMMRISWENEWSGSGRQFFEEVMARVASVSEFMNRRQAGKISEDYYYSVIYKYPQEIRWIAGDVNSYFGNIWKFTDWAFSIPAAIVDRLAPVGVAEWSE